MCRGAECALCPSDGRALPRSALLHISLPLFGFGSPLAADSLSTKLVSQPKITASTV